MAEGDANSEETSLSTEVMNEVLLHLFIIYCENKCSILNSNRSFCGKRSAAFITSISTKCRLVRVFSYDVVGTATASDYGCYG